MQEPMTWPGELGNFVISRQPMQENQAFPHHAAGP